MYKNVLTARSRHVNCSTEYFPQHAFSNSVKTNVGITNTPAVLLLRSSPFSPETKGCGRNSLLLFSSAFLFDQVRLTYTHVDSILSVESITNKNTGGNYLVESWWSTLHRVKLWLIFHTHWPFVFIGFSKIACEYKFSLTNTRITLKHCNSWSELNDFLNPLNHSVI